MRNDFRGGLGAGLEAALERASAATGGEEARREEVARAGRVDDLVDRRGGDLDSTSAFDR